MWILSFTLAAGALAAGVVLTALVVKETEELRLLREEGMAGSARVTRLWQTRGDKPRHWMAYEYSVADRTYRGEQRISARSRKRLQTGSALQVRYVPSNPGVHYPAAWEKSAMPAWVPPLVSIGLGVIAWVCFLPIRNQRYLLTEGRPAPASVTKHKKDQNGIAYHYDFPLLSGSRSPGKHGPVKHPPEVGSTICVLYDPDNPKNNAAYPLALVRLRPR